MGQPPIVVNPHVPLLGRDHLLAERPDLNVHEGDDVVETLTAVRSPTAFITTGSHWRGEYLNGIESGDWLTTMGAGYDSYPVKELQRQGVTFTNTPNAPTAAVAEHTFAMVVSYTRRLWHFHDRQRDHEWDRPWLDVSDLAGDVCCVVGLGRIGEAVAARATAFGMTVRGVKRSVEGYDSAADSVYGADDLANALKGARLVVLAVPLTDETRGLIGRAELDRVRDDGIVVNVARGPVLETDAILMALREGDVAATCLDVTDPEPLPADSPLWDRDDVFVTPHAAGHTEKFPRRFLETFLPQYDRWRKGEQLEHRVV
jgi:D-2-hydroxyacid dehydrogenase (NADP+)